MSRARPSVMFLAWTRTSGRSHEIAAAIGGEACCVFPKRLAARRWFALRYAYSLLVSLVALVRRRPRAIIATNPPVFPGLVARAYATLTGAPYLLDSHPSSFGAKQHVVSQRLIRVHRWLAKGAVATMVTTNHWVELLQTWGARGIVVHEAPPLWQVPPLAGPARGIVLFVGIFASDEPIGAVIEAARLRPDLHVHITGDLARCPDSVRRSLPANVRLLGYLVGDDYRRAIAEADVIVALTTEPSSIVRAGYEAVYSRRPLVVTDWPASREAFPLAVHASNDPASLATAFDLALSGDSRDSAHVDAARTMQLSRWNTQVAALREALGVEASTVVGEATGSASVSS